MSYPAAMAWVTGQLGDAQIVLDAPLIPEGVFVVNLPDRASYRQMLASVAEFHRQGAVFLIMRTGKPSVTRHALEKNPGFVPGHVEPDGKVRYLMPPDVFKKWIQKWKRE